MRNLWLKPEKSLMPPTYKLVVASALNIANLDHHG
jgi:hypothetical protein